MEIGEEEEEMNENGLKYKLRVWLSLLSVIERHHVNFFVCSNYIKNIRIKEEIKKNKINKFFVSI
jgi:hypothetical protein